MSTTAYTRLNFTVPTEVAEHLKRSTSKGDRSAFVTDALRAYLKDKSRIELRKRMIEGYKKGAEEGLAIANEWSRLDDAAWYERNKE